MLRRLLLLFCSACLVAGVGAAIGGGMSGAQVAGCGTPTPSPSPSPSPSPCDTTPPTCKITAQIPGPPKQMQVTAQDLGSGIQAITNVVVTNGVVSYPSFLPGTTTVVLTATKTPNANMTTYWTFDVVDVAGNVKHCA